MRRHWVWVVSLFCLAVAWAAPLPARVDIGRFDSAVVSGFYPVEYGAGTSFRWSYPEAHLMFNGFSGGAATLTFMASASIPTTMRVMVDQRVTEVTVAPGFARYPVPITMPYSVTGTLDVALTVPQPASDGRRVLGVAVDDITLTPGGWYWPAVPALALSLGVVWVLTLVARRASGDIRMRVLASTLMVGAIVLLRRGDAPAILMVVAFVGTLLLAVRYAVWVRPSVRRVLAILVIGVSAWLLTQHGASAWYPLWQAGVLIGSVALLRLRRFWWRAVRPQRRLVAALVLVFLATQGSVLLVATLIAAVVWVLGRTADPAHGRAWAVVAAAYSIVPTIDAWLCGRGIRRGVTIDQQRSVGLDYLRGLVVLFVLLAHTPTVMEYGTAWVVTLVHWLVKFAVEAFFVLSGWLIGDLVVAALPSWGHPRALWLFLHRRWARTLPLYWLVLAMVALAGWNGATVANLGSYVVFIQNMWQVHPPFFLVAWSLSIEEWFYVIAALLMSIAAYLLRPQRALAVTLGVLIVVPFVVRTWLSMTTDWSWNDELRQFVPLRLDAIASGMALVWAWRKWPLVARYAWVWLGGACVMVVAYITAVQLVQPQWEQAPWVRASIIPVMSLGIMGLFPFLAGVQHASGGRIAQGFRWISLLSYPLYLLHYPVRQTVVGLAGLGGSNVGIDIVVTLVFFVGSFWLAACWHRELEQPIMRLRERQ